MYIPHYILSKKFMRESVLVALIFSVIFMIVYKPFATTTWLGMENLHEFCVSVAYYISGITVLSISKLLLYRHSLTHKVSAGKLSLWTLAEVVILALIYIIFSQEVVENGPEITLKMVSNTSICIALILFIPYSFLILFSAYINKREEFELLKKKMDKILESDLFEQVDSEEEEETEKGNYMMDFYDSKDELKLSLPVFSIYFFEAQDNYVCIYYDDNGKLQKYLLRSTLSKVEKSISNRMLTRCHRSYIVNLSHIKEFIRGHNSATLILDTPTGHSVPVSKSYYKSFPENR